MIETRARRFRVESRWFGEVIAIWVEMALNYCLSECYAHNIYFKGLWVHGRDNTLDVSKLGVFATVTLVLPSSGLNSNCRKRAYLKTKNDQSE